MKVNLTSRRQRRARRLQKLTSAREAHRAAMQAGLDYRVSGQGGTLVARTHSLSWHRAKSSNITVPPKGRGWDRSGTVRVVVGDRTSASHQDIHYQRAQQVAETPKAETTE